MEVIGVGYFIAFAVGAYSRDLNKVGAVLIAFMIITVIKWLFCEKK